jgi:sulfur-carrier protein
MRVSVRAYASLRRHLPGISLGEAVPVELPAESSVERALSIVGIPAGEVKLCFVNGRHADLTRQLEDGDEVGVFPPIGGG